MYLSNDAKVGGDREYRTFFSKKPRGEDIVLEGTQLFFLGIHF